MQYQGTSVYIYEQPAGTTSSRNAERWRKLGMLLGAIAFALVLAFVVFGAAVQTFWP